MTKPVTTPTWPCTDPGAEVTSPPGGLTTSGWATGDSLAAGHINWLLKYVTEWLAWANTYASGLELNNTFAGTNSFADDVSLTKTSAQEVGKATAGTLSIGTKTGCTDDFRLMVQDAVVAVLNDLGVTISKPVTCQSSAVDSIPLVAKGYSGQTAHLFEAQDSTGAIKAYIGENGTIYSEANLYINGGIFDCGPVLSQFCDAGGWISIGHGATHLATFDGSDNSLTLANCTGGVTLPNSGLTSLGALNTGWIAGSRAPAYSLIGGTAGTRIVSLRGDIIWTGAPGYPTSPIFTTPLPDNCRPVGSTRPILFPGSVSPSTFTVHQLNIYENGNMSINSITPTIQTNTVFDLDGIIFQAGV